MMTGAGKVILAGFERAAAHPRGTGGVSTVEIGLPALVFRLNLTVDGADQFVTVVHEHSLYRVIPGRKVRGGVKLKAALAKGQGT